MNEDLKFILESTEENMHNAIKHLEKQFLNIRAGKASPAMLGSVMVDYYGSMTPLSQVANINTPDARTLTIQPYEKSSITAIEKGIMFANLGFNPQNEGEILRIQVPPLTEERRIAMVKLAKHVGEETKIGIRNARRHANDEAKKFEKDGMAEDEAKHLTDEIQKLTDQFIEKVDKLIDAKEKDVMTI